MKKKVKWTKEKTALGMVKELLQIAFYFFGSWLAIKLLACLEMLRIR